ncbi:Ig-like domain-containing protein [Staphylococcus sp. GDX8P106P-2]|uniref:Ig-like domain-containing protein n=1 Tax=Staphylococcus sp. GDX8P106P-2 TaxID=2804108 RepID=UPI001AEC21A7|nr:Ig-like domain-containing protein [Staphylococcus sp. GDX8P106P-2]
MVETLKVYKGADIVGTAERGEDGKAKVTVDGLNANTEYTTGTYQVSFENENDESEKVDVPSFKTKPIAVTGVTIAPKTASVDVDATTKLNSTVAPSTATNKAVSYKSSDNAVATVSSNGTVTGIAEGEVTITVTTQDGNKSDTATVTVKKAVVNVTGVTLDKTTLSLQEGATGNLVATVAPSTATDKTVTFASSDEAIATVDNKGKVTAVKPGDADITVTTKDGSKTAKCTLTVTEPVVPEPEEPENVQVETTQDSAEVSAE